MCLWLLTACLGLMPASQSPIVVVPAVPAPILLPTTTTTTTTAATLPTMPTAAPTMPTVAPTVPTAAPTVPTAAPTMPPPPPMNVTAAPSMTLPTPGSLPIDPRLGTTPATSAAFQVPPVTGYSARIPSYEDTVRFPREKRSIDTFKEMNIKEFLLSISNDNEHRIRKRDTCRCVAKGTCPTTTTTTNNGAGLIDVRIVTPGTQCAANQDYCCTPDGTATTVACGTRQTVSTTGINPAQGQANFGEFPWQALVLTKQNDYLAGGLLIDSRNVLTVTHRIINYIVSGTAPNVKVRLGEWDAAATYEPVPYQEYNVQKVFVHPNYVANTLQYDITVLRLETAVPFTPAAGAVGTINRACLPSSSTTTYNGMRCMVAGWGKNQFGVQGQYQQILKKVEVPIVAPATCQTQLQTARLGSSYVLDTTSFVCAGGEANMDSCTGDGGSGLVCQVNGQWVAVGLVAWGLGCASANVPGVYVNIAGLLPWIQQQVATA